MASDNCNGDFHEIEKLKVESDSSEEGHEWHARFEDRFPDKCVLLSQIVADEGKYILHMDGTSSTSPDFAISLSNNAVEIYKTAENRIAKVHCLEGTHSAIIGIKFSPDNDNNLYAATSKDGIYLWDLRSPQKSVSKYLDTTSTDSSKKKTFSSFDVSPNNRILCAGTEVYDADAFMLFWDARKTDLMGGYWESHTDDITEVKFHPNTMNRIISGSTDGLINLYNLEENCEDDALLDTFNTESSVDRLGWHLQGSKELISCITHTQDVQMWKIDGAEPFSKLGREDIAGITNQKVEDCYVVNVHSDRDNDAFCLAGSFSNKKRARSSLCSLKLVKNQFKPHLEYPLKSDGIVRSSWFNKNIGILATGNENGVLTIYKLRH